MILWGFIRDRHLFSECCLRRQIVADGGEGAFQGLPGYGVYVGLHQPSGRGGDGPAEAYGFALDDGSLLGLLEAPVRVQAPEESAVVAERFLGFVGFVRVRDQ